MEKVPRSEEIEKLRLENWNFEWNKEFQFNDRLETYGSFMNDDDFEYWQPCCYEKNEEKRKEAMSLEPDQSLDPQSFEYKRQKNEYFGYKIDLQHIRVQSGKIWLTSMIQ